MDDLLPPGQGGATDDALLLAGAVADGHQPDWAAVEASARTPEHRRFLSRLKAFSEIAGSYQRAARELVLPPPVGTWGSLRLVELLGRGTRGAVYRAHDPGLARDVALKLIIPAPGERAGMDALVHEGQLLARVRHPNVVTVFGAGEFERRVGIWMELVEGRTLEAELAERGPLPEPEIRSIGLDLCRALAAVHGAGVLHRDVKAQNVMRDRHGGRVVLMDFSAGRVRTWTDAESAVGLPGTLAGSPLYVAPEVLAGGRATERSDVYSLGVLLFHLATGEYPVAGRTIADLRRVHASDAPVAAGLDRVSRRLAHVIAQALARRPADRFPSAAAMAAALERARPRRAGVMTAGAVALVVFGVAAASQWRVDSLPFEERDWVLVTPFQNQSGDGSLDGLIQPALEHELANSGFVNVVSRARVEDTLSLMRRPPDTRLDPTLAREVSLRDGGIRAVVSGTILRAGTGLTVQAAVVEPASGRTIRSVQVAAPAERDVPRQLQRLTFELRRALGESRSSLRRAEQELAAVTTSSFEALQLYSRAASLMAGDAWRPGVRERQRLDAARELLRQATSVDPQFASAWLLLAHAMCPRPKAPCLEEAERASALAASATPVERHFIQGYLARRRAYQKGVDRQDHLDASARSFEAALQFVPNHSWTLDELGAVYRELGRHDDASRVAEQAATLRPNSVRFGSDLARVQLARGDSAALGATAARVMALLPEEAALQNGGDRALDLAWVRTWRVHDAWMRRELEQTYREARLAEDRYASNRTNQWLSFLITIYIGLGRRQDTLRVADRLPQALRTHWRLVAAATWEDWPTFERELESSKLFLDPATSNGFLLAWAGQTARAERVVAELRRRRQGSWELHDEMEGQIRVRQGRYSEGVALLAPLTLPEVRPNLHSYEFAARAHWRLGDVTAAVALLEPLDEQRFLAVSSPWSVSSWARCRLLLADIYRDLGRVAEARKVEDDLRRLLSMADIDHPLVRKLAER